MSELTSLQKDKLMSDVRTFIADAEEMMRLTADEASQSAIEARSRVQSRLQEARAELANLQNVVVTRAKDVGKVTDSYVRENPWKSVGIAAGAAAGIGLLVGFLTGRR
jgi:ElaB/YqjD/DUF883 family membrane-anchored ribosome-binding protein